MIRDSRRASFFVLAAFAGLGLSAAACGSATSSAPDTTGGSSTTNDAAAATTTNPIANGASGDDAGAITSTANDDASTDETDDASAPIDAAADAATTAGPATTAMPQVIDKGGMVLATPKVVVLSFMNDTLASTAETIASTLGSTAYWTASLGEYGVGAIVAGAPVHLQRALPTSPLSDSDSQTVIQQALVNNSLGAPDPNTIYSLLVPKSVGATGPAGASSCGFGGYHKSFTASDGVTQIPYAVVVECGGTADGISVTLTHELAEASTDPYIPGTPAYQSVGPHDLGLTVSGATNGSEIGDMCEGTGIAGVNIPELPNKVSRIWSNAAALAGTEPCLPGRSDLPFFMTLPVSVPDMVNATLASGSSATGDGFTLANGASRTIDLVLIGDPTIPTWSVSVAELAPNATAGSTPTPHLTFSMSKTEGQAGNHIALTVTAVDDTSSGIPFGITSTRGAEHQSWYGLVGSP